MTGTRSQDITNGNPLIRTHTVGDRGQKGRRQKTEQRCSATDAMPFRIRHRPTSSRQATPRLPLAEKTGASPVAKTLFTFSRTGIRAQEPGAGNQKDWLPNPYPRHHPINNLTNAVRTKPQIVEPGSWLLSSDMEPIGVEPTTS